MGEEHAPSAMHSKRQSGQLNLGYSTTGIRPAFHGVRHILRKTLLCRCIAQSPVIQGERVESWAALRAALNTF